MILGRRLAKGLGAFLTQVCLRHELIQCRFLIAFPHIRLNQIQNTYYDSISINMIRSDVKEIGTTSTCLLLDCASSCIVSTVLGSSHFTGPTFD